VTTSEREAARDIASAGATADPAPAGRRSFARNTAIFSIATGLSRVAGLAREVLASSYFGTSGPFSAFTIAFQVPNVVRALFADAALSAAFVPVFTELVEHGKKREAFRLASTLFLLIAAVLGAITAVFILGAGLVMPIFTGDKFTDELNQLTVGLSRVLFPIVLLLGLNGLVVGILNAYDHFTIPAISPLIWNVVIMVFLVGGKPFFEGDQEMYAYAIGILAGTVVQFAIALPVLRQVGFQFEWSFDWRDERVKRVLTLMLPVTLGLGLINFGALIDSTLGSLISQDAPRAIDAAFRIYMLPQGMFSVAIATVLFPALSRLAAHRDLDGLRALCGNGVRLIFLLLLPAAAATIVLAEPITRLVYERGAFGESSTELVSSALFWFSFSLPFSGVNLLLTRTFFSLQRPWATTALAGINIVVNIGVSVALYRPLGVPGIVIGTAVSSAVMAIAQTIWLRRMLGGRLEGRDTAWALVGLVIASAGFGAAAFGGWMLLDELFGRSLVGQILSVGGGLALGGALYARIVLFLDIPEAAQMRRLVKGRLGGGTPAA
jgi:putative peptidoglycan lipid II flippase